MIDALYIAGSGIKTQQTYVDVISNNIANVNTPGYKRVEASFSEMMRVDPNNSELPAVGGTRLESLRHVFDSGDLRSTGNALDVAIVGKGFLEVETENGGFAYTRVGQLRVGQSGELETQQGHRLAARIVIPTDAEDVVISNGGEVRARIAGESQSVVLGEIELASFQSESSLKNVGEELFIANDESGPPSYGRPGNDGLGEVRQGFVEVSNVSMVSEMVNLVMAQRAYQMNARVIQTADQLMETANNLSRS